MKTKTLKKPATPKGAKAPRAVDVELINPDKHIAGDYCVEKINHLNTNIMKLAHLSWKGRHLKDLSDMAWSSCCELVDFLDRRFKVQPPPMEFSRAEIEMANPAGARMASHYESTDADVKRIAIAAASGRLFLKGGAR